MEFEYWTVGKMGFEEVYGKIKLVEAVGGVDGSSVVEK